MAQLRLSTRAPLQPGVTRFESLLEAVGLKGPIDPTVRRALLELGEVRHAVVHRSGRVDSKLVGRCPWLEAILGKSVPADYRRFTYYVSDANWYGLELHRRTSAFQDDEVRVRAEALQCDLAITVSSSADLVASDGGMYVGRQKHHASETLPWNLR